MITLKDFMECTQYRITEGAQYQWEIFGPDAYCLDYWNGSHDNGVDINCVFDTKTQFVYEFQAWDYARGKEYRWIHPGYIEGYVAEAGRRRVNYRQSFDDKEFIDLDMAEDILEKASAIVAGEDYDTRILVPLELADEEWTTAIEQGWDRERGFHEADSRRADLAWL